MDSLITRRGAIAAAKQEGDWVRPSDWLPLPEISESEQKFVGLHAIFEDANFVTIRVQGAYTVDWGDGIVENFTSNSDAYHEYNYATYDTSNSTLCSRGYKQAIVTVTPQAGQNLTLFSLALKHNQTGLVSGYSTGWLDIAINANNLSNLNVSSNTQPSRLIEKALIKSGSLSGLVSCFQNCSSLQNLDLVAPNLTNISSMLTACTSLRTINLDLPNVTAAQAVFSGCQALQSVVLSIPSTTTINFMLQNNTALQTAVLTLSGAPQSSNSFSGCTSLLKLVLTNMAGTFSVASCKLSANALNALFTSLGTVTGSTTVTITGNYGAATCDRSIATAKGWTVTG